MKILLAGGEQMGTIFVGIDEKENMVNFCY